MVEKVELPVGVSVEDAKKFLKTLPPPPRVFKEVETGYNSLIRVHQLNYKGRQLPAIQKFWRENENQDWQYGKAITFPYEAIDDLIDGLQRMKTWMEENA